MRLLVINPGGFLEQVVLLLILVVLVLILFVGSIIDIVDGLIIVAQAGLSPY
jgi:hypothetical protein